MILTSHTRLPVLTTHPGSEAANSYPYNTLSDGGAVCFGAGTSILVVDGTRAVENIREGDRVQTADNGVTRVLWGGNRQLSFVEMSVHRQLLSVCIEPGVLGNSCDVIVSRQHRTLYGDRFVRARHLPQLAGMSVRIATGKRRVSYHHLLLEDHQVFFANGIDAESLYLGPVAQKKLENGLMGPGCRLGVVHDKEPYAGLSRPLVKRQELAYVAAADSPAPHDPPKKERGLDTDTRAISWRLFRPVCLLVRHRHGRCVLLGSHKRAELS